MEKTNTTLGIFEKYLTHFYDDALISGVAHAQKRQLFQLFHDIKEGSCQTRRSKCQ
jgi:hypothetical protein